MQPRLVYAVDYGLHRKLTKMKLADKNPVLIVPAMVADSNPNGTMFGGWLMGQIDIAGSIPAIRHAEGLVVTAGVKSMNFISPLQVADLVSLYAEISHVGHTSVTVDVDVWIERDMNTPQVINVANAQLVFVAVDAEGNPRALPSN